MFITIFIYIQLIFIHDYAWRDACSRYVSFISSYFTISQSRDDFSMHSYICMRKHDINSRIIRTQVTIDVGAYVTRVDESQDID